MIEPLILNKKTPLFFLSDYITSNIDYDFYYTHDNARIYITDVLSLKRLLKASSHVYTLEEKGEYVGIILLWKSIGGGKKRYYIKVKANTPEIAKQLLTVLIWNIKKEVYVKIRKDNKFLSVLRNKGFKFLGGRGIQILLSYKPKKEKGDRYVTRNDVNNT